MSYNKNKKIFFISATLGLVLSILLYVVQPVRWESSALIALGQITSQQAQTAPIESPFTVIERLKSLSFITAVAKRAQRPEIASLLNSKEGAGLTVKSIRNGESLLVTVTGRTPDLVQSSIDAVVAELISKHNQIIDDYRADILREISNTDHQLSDINKDLAIAQAGSVKDKLSNGRDMATGFSVTILLKSLELNKVRSSMLRDSISSANIRPTRLLEFTSVSKKITFPSIWRTCLLGTLAGILLGAIWVQWKK